MATTIASQVQALYVGYLGRAADQAGLDFWTNAITAGTSTIESVALGFTLSAEYTALYAGKTNEELAAAIYENVLGRAADADGLAFWVGEIANGTVAADTLLAAMLNSLGAVDQQVIDNKVLVANAFTTAAGENYDAAAGAKVLVGVDGTEASVEAALATIPGATFTLTEGLEALAAANTAKSDLLQDTVAANESVAADLKAAGHDVNPTDDQVETSLADVLEAAQGAVAAKVTGITGAADYADNSDALNAALLSDQEAANAKTLEAKQKLLADANTAIAKVEGLTAAVAAYEAAEKADIAADTALVKSQTALTAAEANFDAALEEAAGKANEYTVAVTYTNTTAGAAGDKVEVTDATTNTTVSVISFDEKAKVFKLEAGITEDDYAGVTTLLAAMNANVAAVKVATDTQKALGSAELTLDYLDSAGGTELKAVADAFVFSTPALKDAPSDAEIQAEKDLFSDKIDALNALADANDSDINTTTTYAQVIAGLEAAIAAETTILAVKAETQAAYEAGYITAAHKAIIDGVAVDGVNTNIAALAEAKGDYTWAMEQATLIDAEGALKTAEVTSEVGFGALVTEYETQTTAVEVAEKAIADLAKAVAELAVIDELVTSVEAAADVIEAAEKAFADNGLTVPVTLDGGIDLATAQNDVFVAGTVDTEVRSMGILGEDVLYVGTAVYNDAKVVITGADTEAGEVLLKNAGDDTVIEFFLEETATGVNVHIEGKAFASSASSYEADRKSVV